jgi:hypothetical protein
VVQGPNGCCREKPIFPPFKVPSDQPAWAAAESGKTYETYSSNSTLVRTATYPGLHRAHLGHLEEEGFLGDVHPEFSSVGGHMLVPRCCSANGLLLLTRLSSFGALRL